jgi:hypothetical protein
MQKIFTGVRGFNPSGRFQGGGRAGQHPPSADPAAGGGLPTAPPDASAGGTGGTANAPAQPNNNPSAGTPPSAPASGSVDLSKLIQNLQKLNIANEPTHPKVTTLAEALRTYFGDKAKIDVDNQTIKITTPQGVRQLEVYTRSYKGNTRAFLRLRVDKNTTRPIGQLLRYEDEYYINANLLKKIDQPSQPRKPAQKVADNQQPTDDKKTKKKLPKSVLYGAGLLAAGGAAVGLSRFLGGGDDDDDKKQAQSDDTNGLIETITLKGEAAPITEGGAGGGQNPTGGGQAVQKPDPPTVTVTEKTPTESKIVVNVPAPQVIREITSGEAPVQTRRKENETVVKAGTSGGVFTLNIGADKTLILKDKEVVGEFPTSEIIRAVEQMADGKTEKEIKRSGEFDDLLKNPWFLVAIALALVAFTRRGRRE